MLRSPRMIKPGATGAFRRAEPAQKRDAHLTGYAVAQQVDHFDVHVGRVETLPMPIWTLWPWQVAEGPVQTFAEWRYQRLRLSLASLCQPMSQPRSGTIPPYLCVNRGSIERTRGPEGSVAIKARPPSSGTPTNRSSAVSWSR